MLNPAGRHARAESGRRATLAHEIADLLLDRHTRLLAAEVFGGTTPLYLEQRARAFAAELLLPRILVARILAEAPSIELAATDLRRTYGISNELLGWQIWHGPARDLLTPDEAKRVDRWRRRFSHDG